MHNYNHIQGQIQSQMRFVRSFNSLFRRKLVFDCVEGASRSSRNQLYQTESDTSYNYCVEEKYKFLYFWIGLWLSIYRYTFVVFNNNFVVITSVLLNNTLFSLFFFLNPRLFHQFRQIGINEPNYDSEIICNGKQKHNINVIYSESIGFHRGELREAGCANEGRL